MITGVFAQATDFVCKRPFLWKAGRRRAMSSEEERTPENTPTQDRNDIPFEKGYQPERGNLDPRDPPQGGSGVPPKSQTGTSQAEKDD